MPYWPLGNEGVEGNKSSGIFGDVGDLMFVLEWLLFPKNIHSKLRKIKSWVSTIKVKYYLPGLIYTGYPEFIIPGNSQFHFKQKLQKSG